MITGAGRPRELEVEALIELPLRLRIPQVRTSRSTGSSWWLLRRVIPAVRSGKAIPIAPSPRLKGVLRRTGVKVPTTGFIRVNPSQAESAAAAGFHLVGGAYVILKPNQLSDLRRRGLIGRE